MGAEPQLGACRSNSANSEDFSATVSEVYFTRVPNLQPVQESRHSYPKLLDILAINWGLS